MVGVVKRVVVLGPPIEDEDVVDPAKDIILVDPNGITGVVRDSDPQEDTKPP